MDFAVLTGSVRPCAPVGFTLLDADAAPARDLAFAAADCTDAFAVVAGAAAGGKGGGGGGTGGALGPPNKEPMMRLLKIELLIFYEGIIIPHH